MGPVNEFHDKLKRCRDLNNPISPGIDPVKSLDDKSMEVNIVRILTSSASEPFMLMLTRMF